jgi:hypothetical protein
LLLKEVCGLLFVVCSLKVSQLLGKTDIKIANHQLQTTNLKSFWQMRAAFISLPSFREKNTPRQLRKTPRWSIG